MPQPTQADDDFIVEQRATTPILSDMTKQAMFNLVPFARSRREVTHMQGQSSLISQLLQADLPQPIAMAIAPTAIGSDHQCSGFLLFLLIENGITRTFDGGRPMKI